ncbi:MAG: polyketide synthase [Rhizobiaceae bacterium]
MSDRYASSREPLAIVGMGCRLPGGNKSPNQFWEFLLAKKSGITPIPNDRWNIDRYFDDNPDGIGTSVAKWGGFLDDIREFDCQFFGISPREAASMDPQQRLLLQVTYEAVEDSRTSLRDLVQGQTGVFVGASQSDYRTIQELRPSNPEAFAGNGYAMCINANRISHRLNLSGPCFTVDTACSSSMVALNQAEQSLRVQSCDVAIVAGVNIIAHPSSYIAFSRAGMLSGTGAISTFDSRANGFVRAEAVGVVIIKPLSKARVDGDRIHALLHATACTQDGQTPPPCSQVDLLQLQIDLARYFQRSGSR